MKLTPTLSTLACSALMLAPALAEDKTLIVTIENIAPQNGGLITPVWIGLHDGTFDIYDRDAPAPDFLEPLAEDGSTSAISEAFAAAVSDGVQATLASNVGIPPLAPGEVVSHAFNIDSNDQLYFSYASMIIPSNDAFIANGNPMAHPLFDDEDRFLGKSFVVAGSEVLDAGTEVNDEVPANTAALAQAAPNTGDTEGGNVVAHPGFMAEGNILAARPGADFLAENYHVLRVTLRCLEPEDDSEALALLDPEQEVSLVPVDSDGTGDAEFEFETEDDEIEYEISTPRTHVGSCCRPLAFGPLWPQWPRDCQSHRPHSRRQ